MTVLIFFSSELLTLLATPLSIFTGTQLYKGRITLSNGKIAIQRISDKKTYSVIHRIEFNPVDSAIQPSNNRGQFGKKSPTHPRLSQTSTYPDFHGRAVTSSKFSYSYTVGSEYEIRSEVLLRIRLQFRLRLRCQENQPKAVET